MLHHYRQEFLSKVSYTVGSDTWRRTLSRNQRRRRAGNSESPAPTDDDDLYSMLAPSQDHIMSHHRNMLIIASQIEGKNIVHRLQRTHGVFLDQMLEGNLIGCRLFIDDIV